MSTQPAPTLVELAKDILKHAEALQTELDKEDVPDPSLHPDTTVQYPPSSAYPDLYKAQQGLVEASRSMLTRSMGPADTIRHLVGPGRLAGPILRVIFQFKIHEIVPKDGSMAFDDLAAKIQVDQDRLERILRLGFFFGLFHEPAPGVIAHTAQTRAIDTLDGWIWLMLRPDSNQAVCSWPEALKNQAKPEMRHIPYLISRNNDTSFFDVLHTEPGSMEYFARAMHDHSKVTGSDVTLVAHTFDWSRLGEGPLVDLGGGNGHNAVTIARAHPELRIVIQDLIANEEPARKTIPPELADRITFQEQDFFKPQVNPSLQTKAFFLKAIMHDWTDDDCVRILQQIMPQVEKGAVIVLCDRVLPGPGQQSAPIDYFKRFMDLNMFSLFDARERNEAQWKTMVKRVDSRLKIEVKHALGNESSLVIAKL